MTQATATSPWDPPREILGCCVDRAYNKGCEVSTCMHLPHEKTCTDCVHHDRCTTMFGAKSENTSCQFFPRRFLRRASDHAMRVARALSGLSLAQRKRVVALIGTSAFWEDAANEHAKLERVGVVRRWIQDNGRTRASLTFDVGFHVACLLRDGYGSKTFDEIVTASERSIREHGEALGAPQL